MKTSLACSLTIASLALAFSSAAAPGAPAPAAATNAIPRSTFTIPASKAEGTDPFFPNSTRLWGSPEVAPSTVKAAKSTGSDCLTLKGLSGAANDPLAMINSRTMGRGETAEILTDCGRLLVHCVDITTNSAIIEVGGERRELRLRNNF